MATALMPASERAAAPSALDTPETTCVQKRSTRRPCQRSGLGRIGPVRPAHEEDGVEIPLEAGESLRDGGLRDVDLGRRGIDALRPANGLERPQMAQIG